MSKLMMVIEKFIGHGQDGARFTSFLSDGEGKTSTLTRSDLHLSRVLFFETSVCPLILPKVMKLEESKFYLLVVLHEETQATGLYNFV